MKIFKIIVLLLLSALTLQTGYYALLYKVEIAKETKNGGLFSGFTAAKNFAWDESENVTNDGVLATFIFTVAEDAPAGDYNIEVLIRSCTN